MAEEKNCLLDAVLTPDEDARVLAVSEMVYSIEDVVRATSLMLTGITDLPEVKNNSHTLREIHAVKKVVDDITTQLGNHWFAMRMHHEQARTHGRPREGALH